MARRTTNVTHGATPPPEPDPHGSTPPQRTDSGYEDPHLRHGGHHDEDDFIPEVTTPQGTQWHAVDKGHEETDVNVPVLIRWGIGLLVLTLGTCVLIYGGFAVGIAQESARPKPTSVMLMPTVPPMPRLIPNPVDEAVRNEVAGMKGDHRLPLQGPIAYHEEQKSLEEPEVIALGLLDVNSKQPKLPDGAVEAVNALNGGPATAPASQNRIEWQGPSDMSGGISNEDRLR